MFCTFARKIFSMEFTAQQIADFLNGTVDGDATVKVGGFSKIEDGMPGTLSFLANPKYSQHIYECKADVILVNATFEPERQINSTLIRVENAYESLAKLMTLAEQAQSLETGVSSLASVADSAVIGHNVFIAPFVYIADGVKIGDNTRIYAHCSVEKGTVVGNNVILYAGVRIYKDCVVGNNCVLHSGVCVGADGFGFAPTKDGDYQKIPQTGNVVIEDNVEIGANTTIDRATLGSTFIRKGAKLDNLIQIAHNVEIGENTVIASQTGVSGSSKVGRNCMIGGQVGIAGHIQIPDNTMIGAQTGVPNTIKEPGQILMGYPALPAGNFKRSAAIYKNLPELQKVIYELQRKVTELETKLNQ